MIIDDGPTAPRSHAAALRIARRCRHAIQAVLREEEWGDADLCFFEIAREEIENFLAREGMPGQLPDESAGDPR